METLELRLAPSISASPQTISLVEGVPNKAITAAFTDTDPSPTNDYQISIDWGDQSPLDITSATVSLSGNTYLVTASHTYAEETSIGIPNAVTVTISELNGADADIATANSRALVADAPLEVTRLLLSASEGVDTGSQVVATFTDDGGPESLADYSATLHWRDGSTTAGTITFNSATGVFSVSGSHLFAEEGNYSLEVEITPDHDLLSVSEVSSSIAVSDPAVQASGGAAFSVVEGHSSGSQLLATFTDPAGAEGRTNYSATIAWGDTHTTPYATITSTGNGGFAVWGSHSYAEEGSYNIAVTIKHDSAPAVTVIDTAQVSDPALSASGGFKVTATEGIDSSRQTVATFTDPAGAEALSNYSAAIDWGDNSTSTGIITFNAVAGVFSVSGSHVYKEEGSDTVTVTIHHDAAPDAVVTSTSEIADPAVMATGGLILRAGEGNSTGAQTVATFTDPGGGEPVANYSANISWGDGFSSAGTISSVAGGFAVAGSHAYAEEGTFAISVAIQHQDASAVTAGSLAQIGVRSDLAGRALQSGQWWTSSSSPELTRTPGPSWNPNVTWVDVLTGDFNGDGRTDYVGRDLQTGDVWVVLSNASSFTATRWTTWNPNLTWADVRVGDFTGDGKDDLVGRAAQTGEIWVSMSTGSSFTNSLWAKWNPAANWVDAQVGDFTGDRKADYTARDLASGAWWMSVSTGSSFTISSVPWTTWNNQVSWVDVRVGDFNGDGKADLVGRVRQTGEVWVSQSTGKSFTNSLWTTWNAGATWVDVLVGDFNGDGKADLVGRVSLTGEVWVSQSTGSSFTKSLWAKWNPAATWVDVQVGDFNGDGKADITGRVLQSGEWWTGLSSGSGFANTLWDTWNSNVTWVDVRTGDFA